jgi:hypothetical protein
MINHDKTWTEIKNCETENHKPMLRSLISTVSFVLLICSCAPAVDEELISYFGAPEENMVEASKAVDVCLQVGRAHQRETIFRQAGFVDAVFEDPERDIERLRELILIHPDSDVVVQIGKNGIGSGCLIVLKGMSPQQSHNLALPWVRHYNAVSNEELGQGLTPNAIQAWRSQGNVFIAAYKTWDILEAPGAAVWLSR